MRKLTDDQKIRDFEKKQYKSGPSLTGASNIKDESAGSITMKKCKACGAEISALADACPKCGHPSTAKQIQGVGAILLVIGLAIMVYFLFFGK